MNGHFTNDDPLPVVRSAWEYDQVTRFYVITLVSETNSFEYGPLLGLSFPPQQGYAEFGRRDLLQSNVLNFLGTVIYVALD